MSLESLRQMNAYNRKLEDAYQQDMLAYERASNEYNKKPKMRKVQWHELTSAEQAVYYKATQEKK